MDRPLCRLFGCRWERVVFMPEEDKRWGRWLWRCGRCDDHRKVWIGYGKPDRFYTGGVQIDGAEGAT